MAPGQILKTPPAQEPLTVAQVKAELGIDFDDDDALIGRKIVEERQKAEGFLNRRLITQVWTLVYDRFEPCFLIPLAPVQAITEVRYVDAGGAEKVLGADAWTALVKKEPARLMPAAGTIWPETDDRPEAVEIDVTVGYGAVGDDVCPQILSAIFMLIHDSYEERTSVTFGSKSPSPRDPYRIMSPRVFVV